MSADIPLIAASLSGVADREWAERIAPLVSRAMLGGISVDTPTRAAAAALRMRGRAEFLPADPIDWVAQMTRSPRPVPMGVNIRARSTEGVRAVAEAIDTDDVWIEVNAHCRQPEMCAAGAGELLLHERRQLAQLVREGAAAGVTTGVKVRAEVPGIDLMAVAGAVADAGGSFLHVDTMDDPDVIGRVAAETDLWIIANNGIRSVGDITAAVAAGAAGVSVGRPSTDPSAVAQIAAACDAAIAHP